MIIIDNLFTVDLVQLVNAACQIPSQSLSYFDKVLTSISVSGDFNTVYQVRIAIDAHPYQSKW